jgi:L-fuconate dehydratase
MPRISAVEVVDVRFPTAATGPGSGTTGHDGTRSVAYVVVKTDTGLAGHCFMFTGGHGPELIGRAAGDLAEPLMGSDVDALAGSLGPTYRRLVGDNRPGTGRGATQLAAAGVVNALWDLVARRAGKPLWRLLAEMEPAELVAACDFRYLTDTLSPHEAREILERLAPSRAERVRHLAGTGYPAYTSVPGSLGRPDDRLRTLCREAATDGWHAIGIEVGRNVSESRRRLAVAREELGPDGTLVIGTDPPWDVPEAVTRVTELARFGPLRLATPTRPDDVAGHAAIRAAAAPMGVATGGLCHDVAVFTQMLRAGALDYCQLDMRRTGTVNEILPVLLTAARFGVPVNYRGGGVGLTELAHHMAVVDFVCVSGSLVGRLLEHTGVPQGPLNSPTVLDGAWYRLPVEPGYSARMRPGSAATHHHPDSTHRRRVPVQR